MMESNVNQSVDRRGNDDEIDLVDLFLVLKKRWKLMAVIVGAACVLAVIVSLLLPEIFRSKAVIMPLQQKSGMMSALGGDLGGLAALAGIGGMNAGPEAKLMAILQSRSLAEAVINKQGLMQVFFEDSWDADKKSWKSEDPADLPTMELAIEAFRNSVTYEQDKEISTIAINADFKDPELSAKIANAVVAELQDIINQKAFSVSKKNRIFIEGLLRKNKRDFLEAGKAIADFYGKNKVSSVEANLDVDIEVERLKEGARALDVDLDELNKRRAEIEKKIEEMQVKNVPQQVYLQYLEMRREVIAKINALLSTQYEMAMIEESKEDLNFQVIDDAVVPVQRYKPKRKLICIVTFMASLFLAIFIAFALEYINNFKTEMRKRKV